MNFLITAVFALLLGACSSESQSVEEELSSTDFKGRKYQEKEKNQEKEETQEVYSLDLQQYYVLGQITKLENLKITLEEGIEGGNRKLISKLETTVKQLNINYDKLNKILDLTCLKLKVRQMFLEKEMNNANDEYIKVLQNELFDIAWKLKDCGKDATRYIVDLNKGSRYVAMSWKGSRCSPSRDYKCKMPMQGKILINLEEELAKRTQPKFKEEGGKVISIGKIIGKHKDFNGMVQIELEITKIKNGILEMDTEIGRIEIPIEVQ